MLFSILGIVFGVLAGFFALVGSIRSSPLVHNRDEKLKDIFFQLEHVAKAQSILFDQLCKKGTLEDMEIKASLQSVSDANNKMKKEVQESGILNPSRYATESANTRVWFLGATFSAFVSLGFQFISLRVE